MLLRQFLHQRADADKAFNGRLEEWMTQSNVQFLRKQPDEWRKAVDAAARSLAYIWTNRFIFYKALRARFPELPKLELAPAVKTAAQALRRVDELVKNAAKVSGDYESLLFPEAHDWANELVFQPDGAVDAWRGFLNAIEGVDFRNVSTDFLGLIFQKLVSPEVRHRYGQHFTGPDPVDLINSFCIRSADAAILDPACGSGSFLVRAYYRKRALDPRRTHVAMLGDLFGCDVALYPAHLATLNLAAREINDQANYPRIDRQDFFDVRPGTPFCHIPEHSTGNKVPVFLPPLDAGVGNPPYVRQEKIAKVLKPKYAQVVAEAFPGTELSGRADLHCYFWPHAARFLKEGGYFGFLTSGQWLDVDYGFALQRWMLRNFRIVAVLESATERWFPDARVKTCITILKRCGDEAARRDNLVRFVRFEKPLAEIVVEPPSNGVGAEAEEKEQIRQRAVDRVRNAIEATTRDVHDNRWRIMVKRQGDLWDEGVKAGAVLKDVPADEPGEDEEIDEGAETSGFLNPLAAEGEYVAGKWGRYLRAPDLYFEVMERFKIRFVPLGSVLDIRYGLKTGCDAFFMPKDVTEKVLTVFEDDKEFRTAVGAERKQVEKGKLKIIEDGAGTLHPIEPEFIQPEVHSLMGLERPVVRNRDLDRVVLLVSGSLSSLKGTNALRYIKYGAETVYSSEKSRPVPVPQRSYISKRDPWYDVTKMVVPAFAFWPKGSQYRHLVIFNPDGFVGNCRLNCMVPTDGQRWDREAFAAVLNSTLVAFWRKFYGRYTGTEGAFELMVLDVNLIDVPDPAAITPALGKRLKAAFKSLCKRPVGDLCEQALKDCHTYKLALELAGRPIVLPDELTQADRRELDDAVFELLGVFDPKERARLIERLYVETALHFRDVRVTEIQKMEDRRGSGSTRFAAADHAADAWNALDLPDVTPLAEWVQAHTTGEDEVLHIPSERPVHLPDVNDLFFAKTIYFGKARRQHIDCHTRGQAELVARMAELGVTGDAGVPRNNPDALRLLVALNERHAKATARLGKLAASRSGDGEMQEQVFNLLERWYVLGKPSTTNRQRGQVSKASD
jgi:type I restriction-modification system DNA methylase subunit